MEVLKPESADQVTDTVAWAVSSETPLEVIGAGGKRGLGRPVQAGHTLDLSGLSGILSYEPAELYLTARAGTPLAEIETALTEQDQMLAFEPADWGPLLCGPAGVATLGGVIASNQAGPRRLTAGAARDHLLGFEAVSGRGEAYKAGATVVKNVTGYDLMKLVTGSYGTLSVLTELTVKVLPRAEKQWTVLLLGLDESSARDSMGEALRSAHFVDAAAYWPDSLAARSSVDYVREAGASVTALRVEGFGPSVEDRCAALRAMFEDQAPIEMLHTVNSRAFWGETGEAAPLAGADTTDPIWRLSVPPSAMPEIAQALRRAAPGAEFLADWGGGLIWARLPGDSEAGATAARAAVARSGGHATLFRAPADMRAALPVFQPQPGPLAALTERVKANFDPTRVLNPGRMYAGV